MKKKILIPIIVLVLIILIVVSILIIKGNKIKTTITIDINPSIEINLDKNDKVYSIKALNDDAKDIINNDLKGKELFDTLDIITNNLFEKGYIKENHVEIVLYSEGKYPTEEIKNHLGATFSDKEVATDIIVIESISKEDKKLAKKYNISPAKASYINQISKDTGIESEDIVNKSVTELRDVKETGKHCEDGYIQRGDHCFKEIATYEPKEGEVCPGEYNEYNGKCYQSTGMLEKEEKTCPKDFTKEGNDCVKKEYREAQAVKLKCTTGELKKRSDFQLTGDVVEGIDDNICADYSKATHPVSPCEANDGTEYTVVGGTCYWHRAPVIESGCPGKVQVGGMCWDNATGIYICPGINDGYTYKSRDEWCIRSIKFTNPIVEEYKCEEDGKLEGNKCLVEQRIEPYGERYCPDNYTLIEDRMCINKNKTTNKIDGLVCEEEDTQLEGNKCIKYEIKDAE